MVLRGTSPSFEGCPPLPAIFGASFHKKNIIYSLLQSFDLHGSVKHSRLGFP